MSGRKAPAKNSPELPKQSGVVAAAPSIDPSKVSSVSTIKRKYYRIRQLSGYLAELIEVEVDESVVVPKVIGTQSTFEALAGRLDELNYAEGKRRKG